MIESIMDSNLKYRIAIEVPMGSKVFLIFFYLQQFGKQIGSGDGFGMFGGVFPNLSESPCGYREYVMLGFLLNHDRQLNDAFRTDDRDGELVRMPGDVSQRHYRRQPRGRLGTTDEFYQSADTSTVDHQLSELLDRKLINKQAYEISNFFYDYCRT